MLGKSRVSDVRGVNFLRRDVVNNSFRGVFAPLVLMSIDSAWLKMGSAIQVRDINS